MKLLKLVWELVLRWIYLWVLIILILILYRGLEFDFVVVVSNVEYLKCF